MSRLAILTAIVMILLSTGSCARATKDAATPDAGAPRSSAFDAWAGGNGTGAFFRAAGPAGGTGVR